MKTIFVTAACILFAGSAMAQMSAADTDGDGAISLPEIQAVMPEMTADTFATVDTNSDGVIDAAELQAAQETGLLPADG